MSKWATDIKKIDFKLKLYFAVACQTMGGRKMKSEINACLGKLPLFIHVLSQYYVLCELLVCEG